MKRRWLSMILAAMVLLALPLSAFAQELDFHRKGSITIHLADPVEKQPIAGAGFSLYQVADVGINTAGKLNYIYTSAFKNCGIDLQDPDLASKLDAFVANRTLTAVKCTTDAAGKAYVSDLAQGLYLVKQTGAVDGYSLCTSFLVTLPQQAEAGFVYDVDASPKTDVVELISLTVKKVWNTNKSTKAADSVTVQLLRDGKLVHTLVLSDQNNWQIVCKDLPRSDGYSIQEVNVPKGFTATYSKSGNVFTVTNTSTLAQTGQLIWPIPVLAFAGLLFLVAGVVILRKPGKKND